MSVGGIVVMVGVVVGVGVGISVVSVGFVGGVDVIVVDGTVVLVLELVPMVL